MKSDSEHWCGRRPASLVWLAALLGAVLVAGCTQKQYRQQADHQVYGIIQTVEDSIFGATNEFTINTKWSEMDPDTILSPTILGERKATNHLDLTLEDALHLAANQSFTYQTQKEQLYLTALTLTGEQYEFGPKFFARTTADGFNGTFTGNPIGSLNSSAGVSQFLKTGGNLSVSLANDILRYYTGNTRTETVTLMSVNFFQPLLRGFGKNNPAVERLTQAERNVIYEVRSYSFFQKEFAVEIVGDYFNLLGLKNIIRNNYSNYVSQVDSTRRLEERSVDRETVNDVNQARQSELNSRNQYVNSIANYFNALDTFKIKLAIPLGVRVFLDDQELTQLSNTGLIPIDIDRNRAFELATRMNLEILNAIDSFEDAKRKVRIAANQLKTDLNIFADASLSGGDLNPPDYTNFDIDNVRYSLGLELDLPLDRLRERNDYRSTVVSFEAAIRNLALQLDSLKDAINRGVRALEQRRQNFVIQTQALQIARDRVFSNRLLLQAGRVTVRDLVESQNAEIDSENAVVEALVSYQNARLDLLLDIGVIRTDLDHFWFASHLDDNPEILASGNQLFEVPRDVILSPDEVFSN